MKTTKLHEIGEYQKTSRKGPSVGSVHKRFWSKVCREGECWLWTGTIRDGYGRFFLSQTQGKEAAHRVAVILTRGSIPPGRLVCHVRHCPNRHCVRPSHLYLGTSRENKADSLALGTATGGRNGNGRPKLTPDDVNRDSATPCRRTWRSRTRAAVRRLLDDDLLHPAEENLD